MIELTPQTGFTTADGQFWLNHDEARAHAIRLARVKNLEQATGKLNEKEIGHDNNGAAVIYLEDLNEFLADNADLLLEALTIKNRRGPKPGAKAAAQQSA